MRNQRGWLAFLALITVVAIFLTARSSAKTAGPSSVSPGGAGLLGARRVLESEGGQIDLVAGPLRDRELGSPLVIAFPWQRSGLGSGPDRIEEFVADGGVLIYAYSGKIWSEGERRVGELLGLESEVVRNWPPLGPRSWHRHQSTLWLVEPEDSLAPVRPARMLAPRVVPVAPEGSRVLYRFAAEGTEATEEAGHGQPAVFTFDYVQGTVVALPAALLSNAHLAEPGNADLLTTLVAWLGPDWTFDEYHHGLVLADSEAVVPEAEAAKASFDLFALHLAVIYGLAVLAVVRRFGPAWREPRARTGSTAAFLEGLGVLHGRLGHHGPAAQLLLERAVELEPRLDLEGLSSESVTDRKSLVRLAREVAERRAGRRSE